MKKCQPTSLPTHRCIRYNGMNTVEVIEFLFNYERFYYNSTGSVAEDGIELNDWVVAFSGFVDHEGVDFCICEYYSNEEFNARFKEVE